MTTNADIVTLDVTRGHPYKRHVDQSRIPVLWYCSPAVDSSQTPVLSFQDSDFY